MPIAAGPATTVPALILAQPKGGGPQEHYPTVAPASLLSPQARRSTLALNKNRGSRGTKPKNSMHPTRSLPDMGPQPANAYS